MGSPRKRDNNNEALTPETCCDPDDPCSCPWAWEPPKTYGIRYSQMFVSQTLNLMWPA